MNCMNLQESTMSTIQPPKPLKLKNNTISWPYSNPNNDGSPVYSLFLDVKSKNDIIETISLKSAVFQYWPKYKHFIDKNSKFASFDEIIEYFDTVIETEIHYVCFVHFLFNQITIKICNTWIFDGD